MSFRKQQPLKESLTFRNTEGRLLCQEDFRAWEVAFRAAGKLLFLWELRS